MFFLLALQIIKVIELLEADFLKDPLLEDVWLESRVLLSRRLQLTWRHRHLQLVRNILSE